jgi:hypothetical protein
VTADRLHRIPARTSIALYTAAAVPAFNNNQIFKGLESITQYDEGR